MEELFNITYRKLGKEDLTFIYLLYTYTHLPKLVHDGMKKAPVRSYTKNFQHNERYEFFKEQEKETDKDHDIITYINKHYYGDTITKLNDIKEIILIKTDFIDKAFEKGRRKSFLNALSLMGR